jgi:hypothetical protein
VKKGVFGYPHIGMNHPKTKTAQFLYIEIPYDLGLFLDSPWGAATAKMARLR